ncbi:MAG: SBBP repeat-containing protein, partial [Anaerolineales bacterium]|nr:SBBP repeat-containing protein [Anaerolineales bacterium]
MKVSFKKSFLFFLTLLALTFSALGVQPAQAADGDFAWAKGLGGTAYDVGLAIAVDGSGNVYTTGLFNGTADFDPGAGTANLTSAGGYDIFVSKLDAIGYFVWAKGLGGTANDVGYGIAVDASGNVYTTGYFT